MTRRQKYIFAPGQYDGLVLMQGSPKAKCYGQMIPQVQVDVRDLNDYVQMAGGC